MRVFSILTVWVFIGVWGMAQSPPKTTIDGLYKRAAEGTDTLYVVNFWATWCRPCVAELPYFEALHDSVAGQHPIKVLLVSIDLPSEYAVKLPAFLKKKKMDAEVLWLDEPKIQTKIDEIDPSWSGAIPATLFLQNKQPVRAFHEGDFTQAELYDFVKKLNP